MTPAAHTFGSVIRRIAGFAAIAGALSFGGLARPRAAFPADLSKVYDAALGGDMVSALAVLDSLDQTSLSPKDSSTASCIRATFGAAPVEEELPSRSRAILTAYRTYWQNAMLHRRSKPEAEKNLLEDLNAVLGAGSQAAGASDSLAVVSERAKAAIESEGLFALAGVTSPFWELMIWRNQTPATYKVKLTDRSVDVRVVFLDEFVSLGWAGYATCGRAHSGGWATNDALYALRSSYDLESEDFRVSYLAHEGRHFSDYSRFPKLEQPELEYRAKLTEIALSEKNTHRLIEGFARRSGRDRSVPHSFANYCVARDVDRAVFGGAGAEGALDPTKWAGVSAEKVRRAARDLLESCDQRLKRLGAATTQRFLESE